MKSKGKTKGKVVWVDLDDLFQPGRVMRLLSLNQDPDRVEVFDVMDYIDLKPFLRLKVYAKLKTFLRRLGYSANQIHSHPIDWRQSLDLLADQLQQALEARYSVGEQVDLLGHSHGGLVARAYLTKYGPRRVARLITLGTPHRGMLKVFEALNHGVDLLTFHRDITKPAARTMPSAYELLPSVAEDGMFIWNGRQADPFNEAGWINHEPDGEIRTAMHRILGQARTTLDRLLSPTVDCRSFFIYGTRRETVVSSAGSPDQPVSNIRERDGDAVVPTLSAMGPGISGKVVRCPAPFANHANMFNDAYVRGLLQSILMNDRLPLGDLQLAAGWENNRLYFADTDHHLAAEIRDGNGQPLPDAGAHLLLYQSGNRSNPLEDRDLPQTVHGDFSMAIPLPISERPLAYKITLRGRGVPPDLAVRKGILRMY